MRRKHPVSEVSLIIIFILYQFSNLSYCKRCYGFMVLQRLARAVVGKCSQPRISRLAASPPAKIQQKGKSPNQNRSCSYESCITVDLQLQPRVYQLKLLARHIQVVFKWSLLGRKSDPSAVLSGLPAPWPTLKVSLLTMSTRTVRLGQENPFLTHTNISQVFLLTFTYQDPIKLTERSRLLPRQRRQAHLRLPFCTFLFQSSAICDHNPTRYPSFLLRPRQSLPSPPSYHRRLLQSVRRMEATILLASNGR